MKFTSFFKTSLFIAVFCSSTLMVKAQFGDILNKAKQRATEKAEEMMEKKDKTQSNSESKSTTSKKLVINKVFDFTAGDTVLFADQFSGDIDGKMAANWKTTASGSVVSVEGMQGKWLKLDSRNTYKLAKIINYPQNFTLEFDVLVSADKVDDLSTFYMGFDKDNSVSSWLSSGIWNAELMYMNDNETVIVSNPHDVYQSSKNFDFEPYANQIMHVSMKAVGQHVQIWFDQTKMADTNLFGTEKFHHFFISAPLNMKHDASILIGNVSIKGFKALM